MALQRFSRISAGFQNSQISELHFSVCKRRQVLVHGTFSTANRRSLKLQFGNHLYFPFSQWEFLICLQKTNKGMNIVVPEGSYNFGSWQHLAIGHLFSFPSALELFYHICKLLCKNWHFIQPISLHNPLHPTCIYHTHRDEILFTFT